MNTYVIKTRGPLGPRGGRGLAETFVVVAKNGDEAQDKARSAAVAKADVIDVMWVRSIARVSVI